MTAMGRKAAVRFVEDGRRVQLGRLHANGGRLHSQHKAGIKCDVLVIVAARITDNARASDLIVAAVMGMAMDPQS